MQAPEGQVPLTQQEDESATPIGAATWIEALHRNELALLQQQVCHVLTCSGGCSMLRLISCDASPALNTDERAAFLPCYAFLHSTLPETLKSKAIFLSPVKPSGLEKQIQFPLTKDCQCTVIPIPC